MSQTNLDKIRDDIQTFAPEQSYEPGDYIVLASICLKLLEEIERLDAKLTRVSNTLANHLDESSSQ